MFDIESQEQIEVVLAHAISSGGVRVMPTSGTHCTVADGSFCYRRGEISKRGKLALQPRDGDRVSVAAFRPIDLQELLDEGFAFLIDESSSLGDGVIVRGSRCVILESLVGDFVVVDGSPCIILNSKVGPYTHIKGSVFVRSSSLESHSVIRGQVVLESMDAEPFLSLQGRVAIGRGTTVGAHCSIAASWRHTELVPMSEATLTDARTGISIGESNWIGQGVHIVGASALGDGCVIAPGTVVAHALLDRETAWGNPMRRGASTTALRGMNAEEACRLGQLQGSLAVALPVYGRRQVLALGEGRWELVYEGYSTANLDETRALFGFLRGALISYWRRFLPWLSPSVVSQCEEECGQVTVTVDLCERAASHSMWDQRRLVLPPRESPASNPEGAAERAIMNLARGGAVSLADLVSACHGEGIGEPLVGLAIAGLIARGAVHWEGEVGGAADVQLWAMLGERMALSAKGGSVVGAAESADAVGYVASEVEEWLRDVLAEYLGVEVSRDLSMDTPFRASGLQSIQMVEFALQVEDHYGGSVDPFVQSTLRHLVAAILGPRGSAQSEASATIAR